MARLKKIIKWHVVLGFGFSALGILACGQKTPGGGSAHSSQLQGQVIQLSDDEPALILSGVDSLSGAGQPSKVSPHHCYLRILSVTGAIQERQSYKVKVQAALPKSSGHHHPHHDHDHPSGQCDHDHSSSCEEEAEDLQYSPVVELAWSTTQAGIMVGTLEGGQSLRLHFSVGATSIEEATSFRAEWWNQHQFHRKECLRLTPL